jgi:hypothetical protein
MFELCNFKASGMYDYHCPLKGSYLRGSFNTQNFCIFPTQYIAAFCAIPTITSDCYSSLLGCDAVSLISSDRRFEEL